MAFRAVLIAEKKTEKLSGRMYDKEYLFSPFKEVPER